MSDKPLDLSAVGSGKGDAGKAGSTSSDAKDGKVSPSPPPDVPPAPARRSKIGDLFVLNAERDTVLYHADDVVTVSQPQEDEDDSFYQVTLDDVKSIYQDLQKRRAELEDAPFKGQKLRALEKETAILKNLHDHPNTALRIRFPDRYVLQGMFRTSDTIANVKAWVREFLADSTLDFYLFTAPPRNVLNDEIKLVDAGLVAMVVIYFGSQNMPEDGRVLKKEHYDKLSDPEKAFELAKSKLKVRKTEGGEDNEEVKPSTETQPKDHSANQPSNSRSPTRRPVDKGKVPKWFKMK